MTLPPQPARELRARVVRLGCALLLVALAVLFTALSLRAIALDPGCVVDEIGSAPRLCFQH